VIKSKVLRLSLPAEVKSEQSVAQRSTTTGHLLLTMPKCNPEEYVFGTVSQQMKNKTISENLMTRQKGRSGLSQDMFKAASKPLTGSVRIDGLLVGKHSKDQPKKLANRLDMKELCTVRKRSGDEPSDICSSETSSEYDEPPPPF